MHPQTKYRLLKGLINALPMIGIQLSLLFIAIGLDIVYPNLPNNGYSVTSIPSLSTVIYLMDEGFTVGTLFSFIQGYLKVAS